MENFQMGEFNLDFEFDFQHDFTAGENRVIDDILSNSIEPGTFFEGAESLIEDTRENSSSFFEYLCNESSSASDLVALEQLPPNQLFKVECDDNQASFGTHTIATEPNGVDMMIVDQNVNFDWTTFLDKSPSPHQSSVAEELPNQKDDEPIQNDLIEHENVIRDNGFVYQELKTLDITQMYSNLGETFGLADLRKIDERLNYTSLSLERQSNQNTKDTSNNRVPLSRKKVFLMPLQLDRQSNESLRHVAENLKNNPLILNSMLQKCEEREFTTKIRVPNQPRQIKQKSRKHLTINEQLEQINTKEIILPRVSQSTQQRRQRKIPPKRIKAEKVPVKFAIEMVLTDINDNNIIHNDTLKPAKIKRISPYSKATKCENNEYRDEPKKNRRPSKKTKTT